MIRPILALLFFSRFADAVVLTNQHVDIAVVYDAPSGAMTLKALVDRASMVELQDTTFIVAEEAKLTLPDETPFGNGGDPIWVLPQSQNSALLYMGFSAEQIPPGVFEDPLEVQLAGVSGPGHFFLWQSTAVGELEIKMNSRDGISAEDRTTPLIGSHEHVNWGFSTNGIYEVMFRTIGKRTGEGANIVGKVCTMRFHVLPLPLSPFQQWQSEKFGPDAGENVKAATADPDADELANIFEYAFDSDPLAPPKENSPAAWLSVTGAGIEFWRANRATDLTFEVLSSETLLPNSWTPAPGAMQTIAEESSRQRMRFHDERPISGKRYYKLQLSLVQ